MADTPCASARTCEYSRQLSTSARVLASKSSSVRHSIREHKYSYSTLTFKFRVSRTIHVYTCTCRSKGYLQHRKLWFVDILTCTLCIVHVHVTTHQAKEAVKIKLTIKVEKVFSSATCLFTLASLHWSKAQKSFTTCSRVLPSGGSRDPAVVSIAGTCSAKPRSTQFICVTLISRSL